MPLTRANTLALGAGPVPPGLRGGEALLFDLQALGNPFAGEVLDVAARVGAVDTETPVNVWLHLDGDSRVGPSAWGFFLLAHSDEHSASSGASPRTAEKSYAISPQIATRAVVQLTDNLLNCLCERREAVKVTA